MSRLLLNLILILLLVGIINSGPVAAKDYSFTDTTQIARVPFDLYFNLIFLQAHVDSSGPLWFMLDSGFEGSAINSSTAEKLGLKITGEHRENAPGGEIDVAYIDSLTFHLPRVDIANQRVMAIPLDPMAPIVGRQIDGILGYDYFNRFVVKIDYAQTTITLSDPEKFVYSGQGTAIPVELVNNEPFLYAYLESQSHPPVKARLKIDTGSSDLLGLNGSYVKAENLFDDTDKKIPAQGAAVGGYTKNYVTRLKSLRIGDITIENGVVGYSDDTTRGGDAVTIAGELFRRFTMTFDFSRQVVYLEKNAAFSEPYEYDMSGIFPIAEGSDFRNIKIQSVNENSPASEAGLAPGDIVLKIDNKSAGDYSIAQIRRMFEIDGKSYRLVIERDGKPMQVELKLRRMI
jgi:hypothetical protein